MTVRWIAATSPLWADMAETTNLTDGSLSTYETSSDSESVGPSGTCLTRTLSAPITAEGRATTAQAYTSWRARGSLSVTLTQEQASCAPDPDFDAPPTGGTASATLQYWSGSAWQDVDTVSLTAPTLVYATTQSVSFDTTARSITQTACILRLVIAYGYTWTGSNNTISGTTTLTEWTLASTDTGTTCDYGDGSGGGDGDGCTCSWTQSSGCTGSWSETAQVSTTWSETSAPTTTWIRRTC